MRKLTQQEIDQAPDWATHYYSDGCDEYVRFQCNIKHLFMWTDEEKVNTFARSDHHQGEPIPRPKFDIWSVKFNGDIALYSCDKLSVTFIELEHTTCLGRTEIIAAAKHLNVTAEELK
jgi:hypothetical protein